MASAVDARLASTAQPRVKSSGQRCISARQRLPTSRVSRRRKLSCHRCVPSEGSGNAATQSGAAAEEAAEEEVDAQLPNSLFDAVQQAGATTAAAIRAGQSRCLVEVSVSELFDSTSGNIMAQEGDQLRVWELCRFFVESLSQNLGVPPQDTASVRAIFPDAGCAAGLAARWANGAVSFSIASLNDRSICRPDDRVLVVCAPDPQGVEASQRVAEEAASAGAAVVLLNPRLASGDAGIGLNARRLRDRFLGTFTVAYSIRPVADGTVFKAYPEPYKVFGADPLRPGRFKLLSEENSRPSLEDVLLLLDDNARGVSATGGDGMRQESVLDNLQRTVASMFRFMNSLK